MVEKFNTILKDIESQKGKVTLFGLMKMDDLIDKWSVVLSATWLTDENRAEMFEFIRTIMLKNLSLEESSSIARIGIFPKDDSITQSFLKFTADTAIKEDTQINGFVVHEGYILASNLNS